MPFQVIDPSEIESGKPVAAETQTKIKENFDDHEDRLQVIESGAGTTYPPMIFRVNGPYWHYGAINNLIKSTTNFEIQITGIRLIIDVAGTSGTTEIDIKFKRGAGAWTSVLSTKPSVSYSSGDNAISTNGVVNGIYSTLQPGDLIRLDLTSVQTNAKSFLVRIDYTGA